MFEKFGQYFSTKLGSTSSHTGDIRDMTMVRNGTNEHRYSIENHRNNSGRYSTSDVPSYTNQVRNPESVRSTRADWIKREEEKDHRIKELQEKLTKLHSQCEGYHNSFEECQKERDELKSSYKEAQESVEKQTSDITNLMEKVAKRNLTIKTLTETAETQTLHMNNLTENSTKLVNYIKKQKYHITQLTEEAAKQTQYISVLKKLSEEQKLTITQLTEKSDKQRQNITQLTKAISRSTHNVNTTTRDDNHFEAEFSSLVTSVGQWVFRNFRGGPEVKHQDLPQTILDPLRASTFHFTFTPNAKMTLKDIETVILFKLHSGIFRSNFVYWVHGLEIPALCDHIGGTDREKRTWHAQTIDLLVKHDNFEEYFHNGVRAVTMDLLNCFESMAKADSNQEQRQKALYAMVEQAAKLEVETYRQVSRLRLSWVDPGSSYRPWLMEDRSGIVDRAQDEDEDDDEDEDEDEDGGDEEKKGEKGRDNGEGDRELKENGEGKERDETVQEGRKEKEGIPQFIVKTVLFPPLVRWEFNEAGNIVDEPVVIRKANVIAERSK